MSLFVNKLHIGIVLVMFLDLAATGHAQYSASVQGTITDPTGAVVAGAIISLTNTATNITDTATTGGVGEYHFGNLLPGDYQIAVSASGFERAIVKRHVSTEETAGVNIELTIGAGRITVEATTAEVGLNPDETRLQFTLTAQDLNDMPLPDRATLSTLRVAPGVVGTIETNGSTNSNIPIGHAAPDARANGRPASANIYLLDRIPIGSTQNASSLNMIPNPDMLAEVALQTTSYAVDNGPTSSIQVDFTSKSGGNKFHGDFDVSYTSKPFEASPDFGGVSPFHRKYFMGSISGPILKEHTFFFGSIQKIDNVSALGQVQVGFSAAGIGAWAAQQYKAAPTSWNTAGAAWAKLFTYAPDGLVKQVASPGHLELSLIH